MHGRFCRGGWLASALAFAAFAFSGVAGAESGSAYWPLANGSSTYSVYDDPSSSTPLGSLTMRTTDIGQTVDGAPVFEISPSYPLYCSFPLGHLTKIFLSSDGNGVHWRGSQRSAAMIFGHAQIMLSSSPAITLLPANVEPSWTTYLSGISRSTVVAPASDTGSYSGTVVARGFESVTVPAGGPFQALRLDVEFTERLSDASYRLGTNITAWLVKDMGLVQMTCHAPEGLGSRTIKLVSHAPAMSTATTTSVATTVAGTTTTTLTNAAARYIDNGDGTVTDSTTSLTWMRCPVGQKWIAGTCTVRGAFYTWDQAKALTVDFAGHSDWRLPNIRELQTLVDRSRYDSPAFDPIAFPNSASAPYWSGSSSPFYQGSVWTVSFFSGDIRFISSLGHDSVIGIRLVRGGQSSALLSEGRPDSDYAIHGDGTVTHLPTGLTWKRCVEGQTWTGSSCSGTADSLTWMQAKALTGSFAGKGDWRLPTADELLTLVDYTKAYPSINSTIFPRTPDGCWSSSPSAIDPNAAWSLHFNYVLDKQENDLAKKLAVRRVRGGQAVSATPAGSGTFLPGWNLAGNGSDTAIDVAASFGNADHVSSVWKWLATKEGWAFYSPMLPDGGAYFAGGMRYDFLTSIDPGEGYWVNAKQAFSIGPPVGAALTASAFRNRLPPGWSLIAIGETKTPRQFNDSLSVMPPAPGAAIPANLTALWAWDAAHAAWYFYAPSLDGSGNLASYTAGRGYLDFGAQGKTLGNGIGFWVYRP